MAQDIVNPLQSISYTDKDFPAIYTELLDMAKKLAYKWDPSISDESDPGVILLKIGAIVADKINYNVDTSILETFPLSVTQESNARQLYEEYGYYMKWYRSATVPVYINWIGDTGTTEYTIPAFTMISDDEHAYPYTLIGGYNSDSIMVNDLTLSTDGTTVTTALAMQGVAVVYQVAGESTIISTMVDDNNRLWFSSSDIAENGVFIRNVGQANWSSWTRVDNLFEDSASTYRYKLGYDSMSDLCYLEFPDNYTDLFGQGIEIVYLKTMNTEGDVPAQALNQFYANFDAEDSDGNTKTLDSSNVKIINYQASSGAADKESIDDAYKNFKKTVGTFKTLITLRDYINYVRTVDGLCSNAFVCDRTNDIQSTYKIQSVNSSDLSYTDTMIDSDSNGDKLTPFSLKFYLLQNVVTVNNSATYYNNTFNLTEDYEYLETALEDAQHIQHTHEALQETVFINPSTSGWYEKVNGTVIATTDTYIDFSKTYYESDGTTEISLDYMYALPNIAYFTNKYPLDISIFTYSDTLTEYAQATIKNNVITALYNGLSSKAIDFGEDISYDYLNTIITNADSRIKRVQIGNIEYTTYANYVDENGKLQLQEISSSDAIKVTNDVRSILRLDVAAKSVLAGVTQLLVEDDKFDYHINQQYIKQQDDNVNYITSKVPIYMKSGLAEGYSAQIASNISDAGETHYYKLKKNELLVLYRPNLIDVKTFNSGIKYEYYINNKIESGESYALSLGEYIIMYKPNTNSDSNIVSYNYWKYGEGDIISPSFELTTDSRASDPSQLVANQIGILSDVFDSEGIIGDGEDIYNSSVQKISTDSNISNNELSSTDTISYQQINEVELDNSYNFLWILTTTTNNTDLEGNVTRKYVLFDEYNLATTSTAEEKLINSYTLKTGEYLFYTDSKKTNLKIAGPGTTITRIIDKDDYINYDAATKTLVDTSNDTLSPSDSGWYELVNDSFVSSTDILAYYTPSTTGDYVFVKSSTGDYLCNATYVVSTDDTVETGKTYYQRKTYTYQSYNTIYYMVEVINPTGSPATNGWYELSDSDSYFYHSTALDWDVTPSDDMNVTQIPSNGLCWAEYLGYDANDSQYYSNGKLTTAVVEAIRNVDPSIDILGEYDSDKDSISTSTDTTILTTVQLENTDSLDQAMEFAPEFSFNGNNDIGSDSIFENPAAYTTFSNTLYQKTCTSGTDSIVFGSEAIGDVVKDLLPLQNEYYCKETQVVNGTSVSSFVQPESDSIFTNFVNEGTSAWAKIDTNAYQKIGIPTSNISEVTTKDANDKPTEEGWYEQNADETYSLSTDTTVLVDYAGSSIEGVYTLANGSYVPATSIQYTAVTTSPVDSQVLLTINGSTNPSQNKWYEKNTDNTYSLSTDTSVELEKQTDVSITETINTGTTKSDYLYYKDGDNNYYAPYKGTYYSIVTLKSGDNPHTLGLYEYTYNSTTQVYEYVLTEDTTIQNKYYYEKKDADSPKLLADSGVKLGATVSLTDAIGQLAWNTVTQSSNDSYAPKYMAKVRKKGDEGSGIYKPDEDDYVIAFDDDDYEIGSFGYTIGTTTEGEKVLNDPTTSIMGEDVTYYGIFQPAWVDVYYTYSDNTLTPVTTGAIPTEGQEYFFYTPKTTSSHTRTQYSNVTSGKIYYTESINYYYLSGNKYYLMGTTGTSDTGNYYASIANNMYAFMPHLYAKANRYGNSTITGYENGTTQFIQCKNAATGNLNMGSLAYKSTATRMSVSDFLTQKFSDGVNYSDSLWTSSSKICVSIFDMIGGIMNVYWQTSTSYDTTYVTNWDKWRYLDTTNNVHDLYTVSNGTGTKVPAAGLGLGGELITVGTELLSLYNTNGFYKNVSNYYTRPKYYTINNKTYYHYTPQSEWVFVSSQVADVNPNANYYYELTKHDSYISGAYVIDASTCLMRQATETDTTCYTVSASITGDTTYQTSKMYAVKTDAIKSLYGTVWCKALTYTFDMVDVFNSAYYYYKLKYSSYDILNGKIYYSRRNNHYLRNGYTSGSTATRYTFKPYYVLTWTDDNKYKSTVSNWESPISDFQSLYEDTFTEAADMWQVPDKRWTIRVTDNYIVTLAENDYFFVTRANNRTDAWPTYTNDDIVMEFTDDSENEVFSYQYQMSGSPLTQIRKFALSNRDWYAYSNLLINSSTDSPQTLYANQEVTAYEEENGTPLANVSSGQSFQLAIAINDMSGVNVSVTGLEDDLITPISNSIYTYKNILTDDANVVYDDTSDILSVKFSEESSKYIPTGSTNDDILTLKYGTYIIPVRGIEGSTLKVSWQDLDNNGNVVVLKPFNYDYNPTALDGDKIYYLALDFTSDELKTSTTLEKRKGKLKIEGIDSSSADVTVKIYDIYKYNEDDFTMMVDDNFTALCKYVSMLDQNNEFNYTYKVDENILIQNPLDAKTFEDTNHIFNKYTICQLDTDNVDQRFSR